MNQTDNLAKTSTIAASAATAKPMCDMSVLVSLYWRVEPQWLSEMLDSIIAQTLLPAEVVLVVDGPVSGDLRAVLKAYRRKLKPIEFRVINLPVNVGLGRAISTGLSMCRHEIVARMDSDDVMLPDRLERQYRFMVENPDITVCSAALDEFNVSENGEKIVVSTRRLPLTHKEISNFAKSRNPINHPAAVIRKSRVEAAGGYEHFPYFEDYYLWAKLLVRGEKFHNFSDSLVLFRQNRDVYRRRGGLRYAYYEMSFQRALCRLGFLKDSTAIKNLFIRLGVRFLPIGLRRRFYIHFLRK